MKYLPNNTTDLSGLVARLTLGLILLPHGAQKLLGLFGGHGFTGTMGFFTGTLHLPWLAGLLIILIEFFGALLLILGIGSRVVSLLIFGLFVGIIFTAHLENGFFMNWFGQQKGEGFEYHLLVLGLCVIVYLLGDGQYALSKRMVSKRPA